jgi:hypothetical protein
MILQMFFLVFHIAYCCPSWIDQSLHLNMHEDMKMFTIGIYKKESLLLLIAIL